MIDEGKFQVIELGVPQGGPISPTIFNLVMEGVEKEIMKVPRTFPIRFADDVIVFAETKINLEEAKTKITDFLKPRGLELNEEKTLITPLEKGVDILGYNLKEYSDPTRIGKKGKPTKKGIVIVKPSKKSQTNFKSKIRNALEKLKKRSALEVVKTLNPIIRG